MGDITLKSGTRIYANNLIIGISLCDKESYELYKGYDSGMNLMDYNDDTGDYDQPKYTRDELLELADLFIHQWNIFKNKVDNGIILTKR